GRHAAGGLVSLGDRCAGTAAAGGPSPGNGRRVVARAGAGAGGGMRRAGVATAQQCFVWSVGACAGRRSDTPGAGGRGDILDRPAVGRLAVATWAARADARYRRGGGASD